MSSETTLNFAKLDMAEVVVKRFVFAIFLLSATMHDGGMKERNNKQKMHSHL